MDNRPIGIFDSGFGGLTVMAEIKRLMPNEDLIYFGDNSRAPYGTKSKETIRKYALQDVAFLESMGIKMIVAACNTASAVSLGDIRKKAGVPVIEVIGPGACAGVKSTVNGRIGVIGTVATIGSGAYEKAIHNIDPEISIWKRACPLFVPIAEEGPKWWDSEASLLIAKEYLSSVRSEGLDTLILGCTHYPLLKKVIAKAAGEDVKLVNSAFEVAKAVLYQAKEKDLLNREDARPVYKYYTSDNPAGFKDLCNKILNTEIGCALKVDIEKY